MPIARVISPSGAVLAEHERDTSERAWLSAVGAASYQKTKRKTLVTVPRYEVGTVIELAETKHRWDGQAWQPA